MITNLKLALQSFKNNWKDYLALGFIASVIAFIGILIGHFIGLLIPFIAIIIPLIISLKFTIHQSNDKKEVEIKNLKIGYITFFKSIKVYFIVILKALLFALLIGFVVFSIFSEWAIIEAEKTIPDIMNLLSDYDNYEYVIEEMMKIESVKNIFNIATIVSIVVGIIVFICVKAKRDYIPFIAFEMPMTSKRALTMNDKILKNKYWTLLGGLLIVLIAFAIPTSLSYLVYSLISSNEVMSSDTYYLVSNATFLIISGPLFIFLQLYLLNSYKSMSKPFKEDFDNELKNVLKEIEELQKTLNNDEEKKDEK